MTSDSILVASVNEPTTFTLCRLQHHLLARVFVDGNENLPVVAVRTTFSYPQRAENLALCRYFWT
jgi:hypothetical protein